MTTAIASNPLAIAPGAYPLVGHLPGFMRDRLGFLTRCAQTNAAVSLLRLDTDAYLLLDAEDIKHVLESNHPNYDKTPRLTSARGRELSGNGVLTSIGREHLEKRKMLQPVFAASAFMPLANIVVQETSRFLDRWRDGAVIDVATELMDLAQQINGRLFFSADYATTDATLGNAIRIRRRYMMWVYSTLLPLCDRLPTPLRLAYVKQQKFIERELQSRIDQRRAEPSRYTDLLARLIQAKYSDGRPISDAEIIDESTIAAITGYETIGEALAWTCLLLTQHPPIAEKLRNDIRDAVGDRTPLADDLPRLKYAEMVLNESMRLYPPTWIYVRMARQADRLPSGVDLPAGAKLYLCPWAVHRSDRYFDDPLRFDPARFTEENRKARPKYAFFPFGGGPRICIGQALAKMQMPLMLAALMQRFDFELLPDQHIRPDPKITLRPVPGIKLRLKQR